MNRVKLSPNWDECEPCPIFASYTLAFALKTEEKARKTLSYGSKFGINKGALPPSSPHRAAIERDDPFMESNQLE